MLIVSLVSQQEIFMSTMRVCPCYMVCCLCDHIDQGMTLRLD